MVEKTLIEKKIDKIAWWIPIRSLRDKFREKKLKENSILIELENMIKNQVDPYFNCIKLYFNKDLAHMALYYRKDPVSFFNDINEFKKGMDDENLKHLGYFINQIKIAPTEYDISEIFIPMNILKEVFSNDQIFFYFNKDILYKSFILENKNADFVNVNLMYFQRGLYYIPTYIKDRLKDTICIDCGAFIGDTAYIFSKYNFNKIYAFEPIIDNCEKMEENMKKTYINDIVEICNLCVSDKKGTVEIPYGDDVKMLSLNMDLFENKKKFYNVDVVVLDDTFKCRQNRIGLIKADVEGYEENILLGAKNIILEDKPILLLGAYHDWINFGQAFRIKKWIEELDIGYRVIFRQISSSEILTFCIIAYIE